MRRPQIPPSGIRRVLAACAVCLLAMASAGVLQAQEEVVEERSSLDTLMDQTSAGNTVQAARTLFHQGVRSLERAEGLVEKAAETDDEAKAAKFLEKSTAANENAVEQLMGALQQNPRMIDAYAALGQAFRRLGKYQEALEIHAIALRRDSESMENFRGWSEALLNLNMLGNATVTYTNYAEADSPRAPILMEEIKKWLAAKQVDPGDLDPAHVQRMADWLAEQTLDG